MSLPKLGRELVSDATITGAAVLPHSDSLERSIVAALVLKTSLLRTVCRTLTVDDFHGGIIRRIFRAICELDAEGIPITVDAIAQRLAVNGGDLAYWNAVLEDLTFGSVPEGIGKPTIARLKRYTKSRKLLAAAEAVSVRVASGDEPDEIAADFEGVTSEFRESRVSEEIAVTRPDLPEAALDGRLGDICQRRLTGLPLAYSWGALVTVAGVMIERSEAAVRSNLYFAKVGPPASGKSVCQDLAVRVLGMGNDPRIMQDAKFGSAEGLALALTEVEPNATRLVAPDELGHLLAKAAIDRSSFPSVLNSAFYRDRQQGGTKAKLFKIDCRVSILGGLTEDMFSDCFGPATVGGLHSRFLFGLCPKPHKYIYRPFSGPIETVRPFHLSVDEEVWEATSHWIESEGIEPRVAENCLRVAYIAAACDGRPVLRAVDLGPALALARYQMRVRIVLAPNEGQNDDARCAVAVRNWLMARKPGEWVSRREVDRGTHASQRYGPTLFNRVLKNLAFNQEIDLNAGEKRMRLVESW